MNDKPDYSLYSWQQLEDVLAHLDRSRYPAQFAALQDEIGRRSESSFAHVMPSPSMGGYVHTFWGWLSGVVVGAIAGHIWFLTLAARIRASGANPYAHDDWGFGWMGCVFFSTVFCSIVGLFVGLARSRRPPT